MDSDTVRVLCRRSDVRRVAINCRCSTRSVVEIPQQIVSAQVIHICPGCKWPYLIHQRPDKSWDIARSPVPLTVTEFTQVSEKVKAAFSSCPFCNGKGTLLSGRCGHCHGSGKLVEKK